MKKIRNALGVLAFVFMVGAIQACADSPTAPSGDGADTECYWIKGTLHCSD